MYLAFFLVEPRQSRIKFVRKAISDQLCFRILNVQVFFCIEGIFFIETDNFLYPPHVTPFT